MNSNCLYSEEPFSSPILKERNKSLGKTFFYTVISFGLLCLVSYVLSA